MKIYKLSGLFSLLMFVILFVSCEEETTTIGSVITTGEVEITLNTSEFNLRAMPVSISEYDSKTGNLMVGKIQSEDYGDLSCSFVTRFMCTPSLNVADSIIPVLSERIDSCKLILSASRNEITGDSLAPQRMTIFKLTEQLPSGLNNNFNPEGYYDPQSPLASKSYTLSGIAENDSAFYENEYIDLTVDLPVSFGREIVENYISRPEIFQWPQSMAENFLPGIYVESSFGNGAVANINLAYVAIYYYTLKSTTTEVDGETETKVSKVNNVIFPFTVSPEVLSSNNILYQPSEKIIEKNNANDGEVVLTTPGGFWAQFDFPAETLIEEYQKKNTHLSTVNDLMLFLPAEEYDSSSGISVAPNLLMVKSSEYQDFFKKGKIPDNLTSFTGVYDSVNKGYYFSTMRNYFLELMKKETLDPEDTSFTLIPVEIETETVNNYYSDPVTYVTKCVPYTSKPTMTLIQSNQALVTFSFSTQMID